MTKGEGTVPQHHRPRGQCGKWQGYCDKLSIERVFPYFKHEYISSMPFTEKIQYFLKFSGKELFVKYLTISGRSLCVKISTIKVSDYGGCQGVSGKLLAEGVVVQFLSFLT